MKLTFVSNYINHHQIPVSAVLYEKLGADYHFIQTEVMEDERKAMGWGIDRTALPYLKCWYEEEQRCRQLVSESDIVVFGGVEEERYIQERLVAGKPVIRYSERLYREGQWKAISPRGLLKKYRDHTRYRNSEVYLLCSGAYVASDFHIVRAYPDKMYKWGYFTETKKYDIEHLIQEKSGNSKRADGQEYSEEYSGGRSGCVEILFAGRFLPLKHPEYALKLAEYLRKKEISFHLTMVGGGEMEKELRAQAKQAGMDELVTFTGFQKPETVRSYMEKADIFLMTSNYLEGWGAVINEAMNSGCAVIADAKIGAVPFLIEHGKNGMVYADGALEEFLTYGQQLAEDASLRQRLGRNAYDTIVSFWNPEYAAKSLLTFAEGILEHRVDINENGPLSKALVISPRKGYSYTRRSCGGKA